MSLSLRAVPLQLLDLLADLARFLLAVPHRGDADELAVLADIGLQGLAEPAFIVGDEVARRRARMLEVER